MLSLIEAYLEATNMKLVYTNESSVLVNHAKNILDNEQISIFLKNEHAATGGYSNFTHMELWVHHDEDEAKARSILATLSKNDNSEEWLCSTCNESNDSSFEICWNCQSDASTHK